jgi:hypothetical protein
MNIYGIHVLQGSKSNMQDQTKDNPGQSLLESRTALQRSFPEHAQLVLENIRMEQSRN